MAIDYTKTLLVTTLNYQKIALQDSTTVSLTAFDTATFTFAHNLGYVPTARVWYEPRVQSGSSHIASGQVWSLAGFQYGDIDNTPVTFNLETIGYAYLDDTNLYVVLTDASGTTDDIPIYYRIYYDA